MDFVENIFGISPDGGSGAFELTLVATVLVLICGRLVWRSHLRSRSSKL